MSRWGFFIKKNTKRKTNKTFSLVVIKKKELKKCSFVGLDELCCAIVCFCYFQIKTYEKEDVIVQAY
jgi:hypothetical protein